VVVGLGALAVRRPWLVACAALSVVAVAWLVAIAHVDAIHDLGRRGLRAASAIQEAERGRAIYYSE